MQTQKGQSSNNQAKIVEYDDLVVVISEVNIASNTKVGGFVRISYCSLQWEARWQR